VPQPTKLPRVPFKINKANNKSIHVKEMRAYETSGRNPDCTTEPLARRKHRWKDNIKSNLKEVRCGAVGDRVEWGSFMDTVMNFRVL
jgi:hypothetical protein